MSDDLYGKVDEEKCWDGYKRNYNIPKGAPGSCVKKTNESEEAENLEEKEKKTKKDACYHKVKSRYKVWPSAYASGALVKCRKVGAKNWGNSKKEEVQAMIEDEIESFLLENEINEDLRKWFGRKGAPGKKGGWVDCNTCRKDKKTGRKKCKPCGRSSEEDRAKYPSCRPTPSACGERGDWGKKSKAQNKNEEMDADSEEKLDKISSELEKASKMHKSQSDRIEDLIQEEIETYFEEKKTDKEKMKCNSPRRIRKGEPGAGKKKFVVKACDGGTEKIIRYGDANLKIKKSNPKRRKSFRARHNCDNPGSKLKARYWSCKKW